MLNQIYVQAARDAAHMGADEHTPRTVVPLGAKAGRHVESPRRDAVLAALVRAAAAGDQPAWDDLVDRFADLIWSITRAHRLSAADAADVSQTTWLRLVEHLGRIRDPEAVGAWLASTARRECLRVLRHAKRNVVCAESDLEAPAVVPPPESRLVASEERAVLLRALETLPDRYRRLVRVLMTDPPPTYEEVAAGLGIPIGSIGPTRARALMLLRRRLEAQGVHG